MLFLSCTYIYRLDTAFYQLSSRLLIGYEDQTTIQELFLNVDSILRNCKNVDIQYTTKENEQYCYSLLTGHVTSFYIKPTIIIVVISWIKVEVGAKNYKRDHPLPLVRVLSFVSLRKCKFYLCVLVGILT